jgi:KTSC domain
MKLQGVKSRMIKAAGYDPRSRMLEVIFRTGHRYRYKHVPADEYEGLINAESKGDYMHKNIIDRYDFERIDQ